MVQSKSGRPDLIRIKVTSMGDGGVGKSCLIKRYCEERFVSRYISTIGVDYGVKSVDVRGIEVRVNFWDLSGHPEFFEVRNEFYKDTQGALLVYDVTSRSSFEGLEKWLKEAEKFGSDKNAVYVVVGNKTDKKRMVSKAEASSWAKARRLSYYEVSANTGSGVVEMFESLFERIVDNLL